ncbi:unnamed protein product [Callosobruchus maculatus]|uniref:DNA polymerase delta small subunit n=1 Tax=Callosobruchus maculatus TaxID=64391 RepID=A0A653DWN6_CALMS|nr:unnamed protein product [Callosobruchus maculatus]
MLERAVVEYENLSETFAEQPSDYSRQYCSIYLSRLKAMEEFLKERVKEKWGDKYPICKLYKLVEENYDECIVIGTIFKNQKCKPSILKQLAEASQLEMQPVFSRPDETDQLFVEDELQRYLLLGNIDGKTLVTGITCALLGKDIGKGKFQVKECLFADYRPQIEHPVFSDDLYVVFASGLEFVNSHKFLPNLEMFIFWLSGMLGCDDTVSKIARVILAGNSIRCKAEEHFSSISLTARVPESQETIEAVARFDSFLKQVCQLVAVDVMPGKHDPSNHILPQKQMHFCMFPKSKVYKSFTPVTNPYSFSLDKLRILGTSGQPIDQILHYSDVADPLDAMEKCLQWNHIAPTAPDTLGCFPYYDRDPFIINDCPHVFFTGNQQQFDTRMVTGEKGQQVTLIAIPEFSSTFEVAVLNLKDMSCRPMSFKIHAS